MTSNKDRLTLLTIARMAIQAKLQNRLVNPQQFLPHGAETPAGSGGVFVTLKIDGELRGCIGQLASEKPILQTVADTACTAAFSDPRFPPLNEQELSTVRIEISRLSALFPVKANDVEIGKHGLLLSLGHRSGVFLPQVPGEQGWNLLDYLKNLCLKAGVPSNAWKNPEAVLEAFTTESFTEQN